MSTEILGDLIELAKNRSSEELVAADEIYARARRKVETLVAQHDGAKETSAKSRHHMKLLLPSFFEYLKPLSKLQALQMKRTLIERLNAASIRTFGG